MSNERYLRHTLIDWFSQEEISSKHIAVVGAGAIGNEVIKNLVLLGVGNIDIYDFDTIEIHNLTRSVLFRETDIGNNKAEIAKIRAKEIDSALNVKSYSGDIWKTLSINRLMQYDCVMSCVDNYEARLKLNQLCLLYGIDLINTGINSRFVSVEVFPYAMSKSVACYECNLPDSVYRRISKRYSCGWLKRISFLENKIPTTIVTSSIAGAISVSCALRLGDSNSSNCESYKILFDSISNSMSKTIYSKNESCIICNIPEDKIYFASDNMILSELVDASADGNINIMTSDPILVSAICKNCENGKNELIFERASNYDEGITICNECGKKAVEVEIRDQFSHAELLQRYYGRRLPSKYIYSIVGNKMYIVNMEGGVYE